MEVKVFNTPFKSIACQRISKKHNDILSYSYFNCLKKVKAISKKNKLYMLMENRKVFGYALIREIENGCYISQIATLDKGKGYGKKLLAEIENDYPLIKASIKKENIASISLFKRYEITETTEKVYRVQKTNQEVME